LLLTFTEKESNNTMETNKNSSLIAPVKTFEKMFKAHNHTSIHLKEAMLIFRKLSAKK